MAGELILMIDDNDRNRELVTDLLEHEGVHGDAGRHSPRRN